MLTYIARRLLLTIPTVFIVTVIVFVMIRLVPGDAVDAMALRLSQQGMEIDLVREEIEAMLGLDVPVLTQYGRWIGILPNKDGEIYGLLQGNLGGSYWRQYTVNEEIARRLPSTLELGLLALPDIADHRATDRHLLGAAPGHHRRLHRPQHRDHLHRGAQLLDRHHGDHLPRAVVGLHAAGDEEAVLR